MRTEISLRAHGNFSLCGRMSFFFRRAIFFLRTEPFHLLAEAVCEVRAKRGRGRGQFGLECTRSFQSVVAETTLELQKQVCKGRIDRIKPPFLGISRGREILYLCGRDCLGCWRNVLISTRHVIIMYSLLSELEKARECVRLENT